MAGRVDVVVEDRDDVRMAQLGAGAALAQEALGRLGAEVGGMQRLERHFVAEADAPRAEHLAHAAGGERPDDLVAAVDDRAGAEHGVSLQRPRYTWASAAGACASTWPSHRLAIFSCTLFCLRRPRRLAKSTRSSSWSWL